MVDARRIRLWHSQTVGLNADGYCLPLLLPHLAKLKVWIPCVLCTSTLIRLWVISLQVGAPDPDPGQQGPGR